MLKTSVNSPDVFICCTREDFFFATVNVKELINSAMNYKSRSGSHFNYSSQLVNKQTDCLWYRNCQAYLASYFKLCVLRGTVCRRNVQHPRLPTPPTQEIIEFFAGATVTRNNRKPECTCTHLLYIYIFFVEKMDSI